MSILCKKSNYNITIPLKENRHLVFNTLSQAFGLLEREEFDLLQSESFTIASEDLSISQNFFKNALDNGFILPFEVNELSIIENNYFQARNSDEILMLTIAPTIGCNFACDYCFQEHENKSGMSEAVQDKICEFIEYVFRARKDKFKHLHICWYGGEPLIKFKIIKNLASRFIKFCEENTIQYTSQIITNGYLLNLEVAKELHSLKVSQCQITLDGSANSHDARRHLLSKKGTFSRIISNILSYVDQTPIKTSIRVNIDRRNIDDIPQLLEYLNEIKLSNKNNLTIYFAPVESTTAACKAVETFTLEKTEMAQSLFKLYVRAVELGLSSVVMPPVMLGLCTAAKKNGFVISPTGECFKCFDLITYNEYSIGSILTYEELLSPFIESVNAKKWSDFSPFQNEICKDCVILPTCVSFCPLKFVHADTVNGKSILPCPEWKFNIKEKLIFAAVKQGVISELDYNKDQIATKPAELSLSGKCYTVDNMQQFKTQSFPSSRGKLAVTYVN